MEFNLSETCYLTRIHHQEADESKSNPRFHLRWFTPVAEVELCGHATLASAHVLFTSGVVKSDVIEFLTLSGILTARKIPGHGKIDGGSEVLNTTSKEDFLIELDFPTISVIECEPNEIPYIPKTLNGASVINIKKTSIGDDLIRSHYYWNFSSGSKFDFFSRFFCPKLGINEDPVTGSIHCALAPYWSQKLGKSDFLALQASPRGGVLDLHLDEETQRVKIRGKAVTVMEGCVFASC
ncbi:hypothetical protein MKW94_012928 [Papaver nudicaule]|uniref:Uncharacterized protein n=1 Tax=Papaver nudicaule TaxID=74823 RepID=A0AA41SKX8_PAPNU|nr:hypothetical protein [Papaver nudicaule]